MPERSEQLKEKIPSEIHPDYLGCFEIAHGEDHYSETYFVRAESPERAIEKLAEFGFNMKGRPLHELEDSSKEWYASPAHPFSVDRFTAISAYGVTLYWYLDM